MPREKFDYNTNFLVLITILYYTKVDMDKEVEQVIAMPSPKHRKIHLPKSGNTVTTTVAPTGGGWMTRC